MIQSAAVRKILLVLVLSILIVPWASAAGTVSGNPESSKGSLSGLLVEAWSFVLTLWSDTGCHIDPDGRCVRIEVDSGCHIDPSGAGCHQ